MRDKTEELISMVESLPIDLKTKLVEKILNSIHPTQKEIDDLWAQEVEKRFQKIKSGRIKTVPAEEVFAKIQKG